MERPLVSVVIPTYNRAASVKKTLDSVFLQTYKNLEIIIIDDCSTDDTSKVLYVISSKDNRVRVLRNEKNLRLVRTLNKGVKAAKGKYIARLDDDDVWLDADKIEKQINFLESHPDYVLTGGGVIKVDEQGGEISRVLFPKEDIRIREAMLFRSLFIHSAVVFRRDVFDKIGGYNENLSVCEDYDLWLRMGRVGKLYNFPDYFVRYAESDSNLSNTQLRKIFWRNVLLVKKYGRYYPHFKKAFFLRIGYYLYSFIPFYKQLMPLFSKAKRGLKLAKTKPDKWLI